MLANYLVHLFYLALCHDSFKLRFYFFFMPWLWHLRKSICSRRWIDGVFPHDSHLCRLLVSSLIAPQRKKQRSTIKWLKLWKKVLMLKTVGGNIRNYHRSKDDRFVIRIAENVKVQVARDAISARLTDRSRTPCSKSPIPALFLNRHTQ